MVNLARTMLRGSVQRQLTQHLLDDPADFRRNDALSELLIVLDDLDGLWLALFQDDTSTLTTVVQL